MRTRSSKRVVGLGSLVIAAMAAASVACSAEDTTDLEPGGSEEAELGGSDSSIPLADKYEMALTADERDRLDAYYASQGMPEDQVSYHGRVIMLEGDMMVDADYVLSAIGRVEKGHVHRDASQGGTNSLSRCNGVQAVENECPTGKFQFFRPWIDTKYYVVVGDAFTPSYYLDLVNDAVKAVEDITNDKPDANLFDVKTRAQYDALSDTDKLNYEIFVTVSTTVCPGATNLACMEVPIQTLEQTPTGQKQRMRLGRTLGIRQDKILNEPLNSPERAKNVGTLIHEFLHAFGIGHMNFQDVFFKLYVPGTLKPSANPPPPSVMWTPRTDPNRRHTPQPDDIDVMRTLFPPNVFYFNGFSTVNAN